MKSLFALLWLVVLGACSGGGDNGQTPAMNPLLDGLSGEHESRITAWKKSVLKSCDVHEIFSDRRQLGNDPGIDLRVLLESNDNSLVFQDQDRISIVTGVEHISGQGNSLLRQSYSVNGTHYALEAETRFEGSNCSLYISGKKIHETFIARSLNLGASFSGAQELKATSSQMRKRTLNGHSLVRSGAVSKFLDLALRPSNDVYSLFAQKLGTNLEVAQRLAKPRHLGGEVMVRLMDVDLAVWSGLGEGEFIGSGAAFERLAAAEGDVKIEIRLPIGVLSVSGVSNSADVGVLGMEFDLSLVKREAEAEATLKAYRFSGKIPFNPAEAKACVVGRFEALLEISQDRLSPSMQDAAGSCRILNPAEPAFGRPLLKKFVPKILKGLTPNPTFNYAGWDRAISELAISMTEQGQDIQSLDPNYEAPIVKRLSEYLQTLSSEMQNRALSLDAQRSVLSLGTVWAFNGQIVPVARIRLMISAFEKNLDAFKASGDQFIQALATHPLAFGEELHFASTLSDSYRSLAQRGANLSTVLNSQEYFKSVLWVILQKMVSEQELQGWVRSLSEVDEVLRRHPGIQQSKGSLTDLALKWRRSSEVPKEEVEKVFSAVAKVEAIFPESTQALLTSLGSSYGSGREAVEFALRVTPAYVDLLRKVVDDARSQEQKSWGDRLWSKVLQERPSMEQLRHWEEFFLEAKAFTTREQQRTRDDWSSSNERNRKEVLKFGLEEGWRKADFAVFEAAAMVATYRSVCSHRKGLSSLADCAGLSKFSKKKGMLLDPAFEGRYLKIAKVFTAFLSRSSAHFSLNFSLISEFFEPIWNRCDNTIFVQRTSELEKLLEAALKDPHGNGSFERDRAIREILRNCQ